MIAVSLRWTQFPSWITWSMAFAVTLHEVRNDLCCKSIQGAVRAIACCR